LPNGNVYLETQTRVATNPRNTRFPRTCEFDKVINNIKDEKD